MSVLAVWSPVDGALGAVAPLALATAGGTALVIDLDPAGPHYPGDLTLAALVADGPHRDHLEPQRRGVAVLRNGGVDETAVTDVVAALSAGWPRVVLRMPCSAERPDREGLVPVLPILPGPLMSRYDGPAVHQRGPWKPDRDLHGVVLPRPRAGTIRSLLDGRRPTPSRWMQRWSKVWELPWP